MVSAAHSGGQGWPQVTAAARIVLDAREHPASPKDADVVAGHFDTLGYPVVGVVCSELARFEPDLPSHGLPQNSFCLFSAGPPWTAAVARSRAVYGYCR
jgi:hypothetical protein